MRTTTKTTTTKTTTTKTTKHRGDAAAARST
jgi:hypothetical protein